MAWVWHAKEDVGMLLGFLEQFTNGTGIFQCTSNMYLSTSAQASWDHCLEKKAVDLVDESQHNIQVGS